MAADAETQPMHKWWAVFIAVAVVVVAIAGPGVAEAANPGGKKPPGGLSSSYGDAETLDSIANILSSAQADMANTANAFVADAPSAGSQSEFDSMQGTAEFRIGVAKGIADTLLRGIRDSAGPGPVYDAAVAALQELSASRDAAIALVQSVEYSGSPTATTTTTQPAPTTTTSTTTTHPQTTTTTTATTTTATTTTTTTTTTTVPRGPTTTSIPGASSATTVPGSSTTTTVPGTSNTTTTVAESSTTTTIPGSTTTTTVVAPIAAPDSGSTGGGGGFAMAMPPHDAMLGPSAAEPEPPSPIADLSGWVSSMLGVVLPPMVVAVVLSPLVIIEVIGRTAFRSGAAILLPILVLGLTLLFFRWKDRKRETARPIAAEGPETATA